MTCAAQIRSEMRAMRRALDSAQQEAAAAAVWRWITDMEAYRQARCVMAYMAAKGELSLLDVAKDVLARGKTLVLPRCEAPGVMTARQVENLDQLVKGAYGLSEPEATCRVADPMEIDLILVPGTAFDRAGHRIGQGGGFYDRYLCAVRAQTVGVCHDFALLERIPAQAHDRMMDKIVTPSGVLTCGIRHEETQGEKRQEVQR